jgi:hypothetical protein
MKYGKLVYLSKTAAESLEDIGQKYISRRFKEGKRVSYNQACLYLIQMFRLAENLKKKDKIISLDEKNEEI